MSDRVIPIPSATCRLQFNRGFTLTDARRIIPYLAELGISHVYASPLLAARPGSAHGYDVCDPTRINPEIGSEEDLDRFVRALREREMGLVLDLVPNHMGVGGPENPWWWDVLRQGRSSPYAAHFDIDWDSPDPALRGKVLLPVLGDELAGVLARGELKLVQTQDDLQIGYYDHRFPLSPESVRTSGKSAAKLVAKCNSDAGALRRLLDLQHYHLAFWRDADARLNYRRFFNISSLAGLRVEAPQVFNDVHRRVLDWYQNGWIDGLRIDHPDGLYDPEQYLVRLRKAAPRAWIVVEKVLVGDEKLPAPWPIQGTTGYDFLNRVGGLFIDPDAEPALTEFYAAFTGEPTAYDAVMLEKKRLALRQLLQAETDRLVALLDLLAAAGANHPFNEAQERDALIEMAACFPVYRTYVRAAAGAISREDIDHVETAAAGARRNRPELGALFDFLRDVLVLRKVGAQSAEFVMRFQQLTGPAMAKGVEDTTLYCYNRFAALNEVGGSPGRFGIRPDEFHRACATACRNWPSSLLATSTHDTKRSEDVRSRLALLSEIPGPWSAAVRRWSAMLEKYRRGNFPDRNAEYLFYQTLAGAWPLSLERALAYMEKASREAKQHTSWTNADPGYDQALKRFVAGALEDQEFVADLGRFITPLIEPGRVNSLSQTLIKLAAPGVPDIYQGAELWDLSLVDPDNRRPVDFELRRRFIAELKHLAVDDVLRRADDGLPKLWLIQKILRFRRRHPVWFRADAGYEPLSARGAKSDHVVAFARGGCVLALAPRLVLGLGGEWADTVLTLPDGAWSNELTGESVAGGECALRDLLRRFPVALFSKRSSK